MATLRTFRDKEGDVLFGQNLAVDGSGWLEAGIEGRNPGVAVLPVPASSRVNPLPQVLHRIQDR